ncbi:MAG: ribonuclease R [Rhodospirillales bacterium]|nr:ribonuclease R [Rhodospirillales bacterium]
MPKKTKTPPDFPSKRQILEFIEQGKGKISKREIARAFHISVNNRPRLKKVLREMKDEGLLSQGRGKRLNKPGQLPPVTVLQVTGMDNDGELLARPISWEAREEPPRIFLLPERKGKGAVGVGDRVLARLNQVGKTTFEARTIRRIEHTPSRILGVYMQVNGEGRIVPTDRKQKNEMFVPPNEANGAERGDLVHGELLPGRQYGLRRARIVEKLGRMGEPKSVSLIAIHTHDIPLEFPRDVIEAAQNAGPAPLDKREDLRSIDLVTIDGADARDFDDAVWAEPDTDENNKNGWHVIIAIADVAYYVRPNTPLDKEAYKRGNSVYFPDRVVPMLPEALSNGWCSLVPHEDRPCLAVHMWIGPQGKIKRHKFVRGIMRSSARLTYEQAQAAFDGQTDGTTAPILEGVIKPLYGAYDALLAGRKRRGVLELDLPERRILLDDEGNIEKIALRERLDSHRLIEEFMISANVAAAETLERKKLPCMYRVHDQPTSEKLEALREFLESMELTVTKGVLLPKHFNHILEKVADTPQAQLVSQVILRSQAQAIYSPENLGHFGLALNKYAHFTSPIRRYSDLLVHRALIRGLGLGDGKLEDDHKDFTEMGEHISITERRAQVAERDANDRYTALYLADHIGETVTGRVNGVTRFGLFVTLNESGGDGLVPIGTLPDDFYHHDEKLHSLVGDRTGREFRLGDQVEVRILEAEPISGSLIFEIQEEGSSNITLQYAKTRSSPRSKGRRFKHKGRRKARH